MLLIIYPKMLMYRYPALVGASPCFRNTSLFFATPQTPSDPGTSDTTLFFISVFQTEVHWIKEAGTSALLTVDHLSWDCRSMNNMQKRMLVAIGLLHRSNNTLTILNTQNSTLLPERFFFCSLEEFPRQRNAHLKLKKTWALDICISLFFISSPNTLKTLIHPC